MSANPATEADASPDALAVRASFPDARCYSSNPSRFVPPRSHEVDATVDGVAMQAIGLGHDAAGAWANARERMEKYGRANPEREEAR